MSDDMSGNRVFTGAVVAVALALGYSYPKTCCEGSLCESVQNEKVSVKLEFIEPLISRMEANPSAANSTGSMKHAGAVADALLINVVPIGAALEDPTIYGQRSGLRGRFGQP